MSVIGSLPVGKRTRPERSDSVAIDPTATFARSIIPCQKPRRCRGLSCRDSRKSELPDDGTTPVVEVVVDASGDEVHILADRVSAEYAADRYDTDTQNTCRREVATMVTHEQVIVLDRNRPIRCESEFEARSDDTTPPCFIRRIE